MWELLGRKVLVSADIGQCLWYMHFTLAVETITYCHQHIWVHCMGFQHNMVCNKYGTSVPTACYRQSYTISSLVPLKAWLWISVKPLLYSILVKEKQNGTVSYCTLHVLLIDSGWNITECFCMSDRQFHEVQIHISMKAYPLPVEMKWLKLKLSVLGCEAIA